MDDETRNTARKLAAIQGSFFVYSVPIDLVSGMLARNGVQWPHRTKDIADENALQAMWDRIIREHMAKWLEEKR